jgi:hypothetical protein
MSQPKLCGKSIAASRHTARMKRTTIQRTMVVNRQHGRDKLENSKQEHGFMFYYNCRENATERYQSQNARKKPDNAFNCMPRVVVVELGKPLFSRLESW